MNQMGLFYEKINVVRTAVISLLCMAVGAVGGSRIAIIYHNNRLMSGWWATTPGLLNNPLTRFGMIVGGCCGIIVGYLWCRYMAHRTKLYKAFEKPYRPYLIGEGIIIAVTLGWLSGAVILAELHVNASAQLLVRDFWTLIPICIAFTLLASLIAGCVFSFAWTFFGLKKSNLVPQI